MARSREDLEILITSITEVVHFTKVLAIRRLRLKSNDHPAYSTSTSSREFFTISTKADRGRGMILACGKCEQTDFLLQQVPPVVKVREPVAIKTL
jgi:hypothetical protein